MISNIFDKYPFVSLIVRSILQPRSNFRVYCIGAVKTGTNSLASLFSKNYRSYHEPGVGHGDIVTMLEKKIQNNLSKSEIKKWIRRRDWKYWLDCESSHIIAWFVDAVAENFPDAIFILTVRDCYSWLDSVINQHMNRKPGENYTKLRELYHGGDYEYEVSILKEKGLYTLDGYLSYWAKHNTFVLNSIPVERLLVIPTKNISENISSIAEFVGVPEYKLNIEGKHSYPAKFKNNILDKIDHQIIKRKIEQNCSNVIDRINNFHSLKGIDLVGIE